MFQRNFSKLAGNQLIKPTIISHKTSMEKITGGEEYI